MSGIVTIEQLGWLIGVISAASGLTAGALLWVWRIVVGVKAASAAETRELAREMGELRKQMGEQAVHISETYATKEGVTAGLNRVEKAIDRLNEQFASAVERLTERLDRFLEGPGKR